MADMFNKRNRPIYWVNHVRQHFEQQAYYEGTPYPLYAFKDWKKEELDRVPTCLPLSKAIVRKSALWLFKEAPSISFSGKSQVNLEKLIRDIWAANKMDIRMLQAAQMGGISGRVHLMYGVDPDDDVHISILPARYVQEFSDPLFPLKREMVRIQHPVCKFDTDGKPVHYWYRQEISKEKIVTYKLKRTTQRSTTDDIYKMYAQGFNPTWEDVSAQEFELESVKANPYKIIPIVAIDNFVPYNDWPYGLPDCAGVLRTFDRFNLTFHLMDKSNQLHSDPEKYIIDAEDETDEDDMQLAPGTARVYQSRESEEGVSPHKAQVGLLEPSGVLRGPIREYGMDVLRFILEAVGSAMPNPEEITNKGTLTTSVLVQMYHPLIETTLMKRKSYGDEGICEFLSNMCTGLSNYGVKGFKKIDKSDIVLGWREFFELTEQEKTAAWTRLQQEFQIGVIKAPEIVTKVVSLEKFEVDSKELLGRVEADLDERQENAIAATDPTLTQNPTTSTRDYEQRAPRAKRKNKSSTRVRDKS